MMIFAEISYYITYRYQRTVCSQDEFSFAILWIKYSNTFYEKPRTVYNTTFVLVTYYRLSTVNECFSFTYKYILKE